uniref:Uncharacterized protein n=1 Tax=Strongyloides stercoralis TaxID=6248 RepID=A0A0K0E485_STRER
MIYSLTKNKSQFVLSNNGRINLKSDDLFINIKSKIQCFGSNFYLFISIFILNVIMSYKSEVFENGVILNTYLMMRFYFNLNILSIPCVLGGFIQSLKSLFENDYFPNGDITKNYLYIKSL